MGLTTEFLGFSEVQADKSCLQYFVHPFSHGNKCHRLHHHGNHFGDRDRDKQKDWHSFDRNHDNDTPCLHRWPFQEDNSSDCALGNILWRR